MRTVFTTEDVKNIVDNIFNGNLWASKYSNGTIQYANANSEKIVLINEQGEQTETDLANYLNIRFYNWKQRLVDKGSNDFPNSPYYVVDDWVASLNLSTDESYALVEKIDEDVVASQDIDSATILGRITFIVQSNKVWNLDYYVSKLRNSFLGVPQDIQNSYGETIKAFILLGTLIYDTEPFDTQLGECMQVSVNFKISYLADALTYSDTKVEISLQGDDTYTEQGVIPDNTNYKTMPITKSTEQKIFTMNAVTTQGRPDLTGYLATAISSVRTFTFYDFNKELTNEINELFYELGAISKNGVATSVRNVNIPVYIRITIGNDFYVYKDVIEQIQKVRTNNDFNISSITLRGYGKID